MSQENVEIVRKAIAAATRRPTPDWKIVNELYHRDHELHSLVEAIEGGHAPGDEGGRDFLERMNETGDWSVDVEDVRKAHDGRVVTLMRFRMRPKRGDVPLELRRANVSTLREGRICRTDIYATWAEALEAVGLSEEDAHAHS